MHHKESFNAVDIDEACWKPNSNVFVSLRKKLVNVSEYLREIDTEQEFD